MRCPIESHDSAELLLAYCARKLEPEMAAILERHMEVCPDCLAFYEGQKQVWDALDSWEAEPVSDDFDSRLYARIEREPVSFWTRMRGFYASSWPRRAIPLTAAAGLLLTAGLILQLPEKPTSVEHGSTAAKAEVIAPDQLERTVEDMELLRQFTSLARTEGSPSDAL